MEIQPIDPEFVRVWSRVKGEKTAPPEEPEGGEWGEFLTGKIRAELQRRRDYCTLGLAGPAGDSLERAKKLSTAWFFRSGERYRPENLGRGGQYPSRPEAVRQLYLGEGRSERDYRQAAAACGAGELAAVFTFCAESCQKTLRRLWQLAEG